MGATSPALSGMPQRVRLGGCDRPALMARLVAAGVRLNPLAEQLLDDARLEIPHQPADLTVVAVNVAALGHAGGATFDSLAAAAATRGWTPGPRALAPFLRLQWLAQAEAPAAAPTRHRAPPGALTVATVPPADTLDQPWGFYLRCVDGVPWLRGYRCWSGHLWAPDDVLVFAQARGAEPMRASPSTP
jgi:hypothetical protein